MSGEPSVVSSLSRRVGLGDVVVFVRIKRSQADSLWTVEFDRGRDRVDVWDERFADEQTALQAALDSIEAYGL